MIFKIKLEDKAALLNRMEKADDELSSNQIKDNRAEGYFELTVNDPKQLEIVKSILNKSPKINTIKEMKNSLTKNELQEMIRQQLQTTLAEKKKVKGEKEKEKLDEVSDVLIAGLATLLGVGGTIVAALVSDLRKAKTKEEKAAVLRRAASTIDRKMSGGM